MEETGSDKEAAEKSRRRWSGKEKSAEGNNKAQLGW